MSLGAASLAHDAVLLKPAPDLETRGSPHLSIYRGPTPSKQQHGNSRCPGPWPWDWRLAIGHREPWPMAARGSLSTSSRGTARGQSSGSRPAAACGAEADAKDKHEELEDQQANENEPRPRRVWMEHFGSLRTQVQRRPLSRLLRVSLTRDISFWFVFSFIQGESTYT